MTTRGCSTRAVDTENGCRDVVPGMPDFGKRCVCNTDLCNKNGNGSNGAMMTSSFGHVIIVIALLINVVIGHVL